MQKAHAHHSNRPGRSEALCGTSGASALAMSSEVLSAHATPSWHPPCPPVLTFLRSAAPDAPRHLACNPPLPVTGFLRYHLSAVPLLLALFLALPPGEALGCWAFGRSHHCLQASDGMMHALVQSHKARSESPRTCLARCKAGRG